MSVSPCESVANLLRVNKAGVAATVLLKAVIGCLILRMINIGISSQGI